jgi:hypothetical protein
MLAVPLVVFDFRAVGVVCRAIESKIRETTTTARAGECASNETPKADAECMRVTIAVRIVMIEAC